MELIIDPYFRRALKILPLDAVRAIVLPGGGIAEVPGAASSACDLSVSQDIIVPADAVASKNLGSRTVSLIELD